MTRRECATATGAHYTTVCNWEYRSGLKFKQSYIRAKDIPEAKRADYDQLSRSKIYRRHEVLELLGLEYLAS
jgi:hypothetical protein